MGERNVGGLWCREVLGLLDRYVDGTLEADELASVQAHVRGCDHCARFGGAYARVVSALRVPPEDAPPAAVMDRLTARLRAHRS
jgi:anti-sigma factor RsiW